VYIFKRDVARLCTMPEAKPSLTAPTAPPARNLRAVATVGAMTAVSRVAGLAREFLMAACFGTSVWKSAFNIAFQIPNLFRRLLGEGALSAAFVPVFTETLHGPGGLAEANRLAARVAGLLVAALTIATALGMLLVVALQR
jgi:putative peptidoglycan lipid II flippase